MFVFESKEAALASNLKDKEQIKIWEDNKPRFFVYVKENNTLIEFFVDQGLNGFPEAHLFPDNYTIAAGKSIFKVHDGYWVEFPNGILKDYRATFNLFSTMEDLDNEFQPPKNCSNAITYSQDLGMLVLGVWINKEIQNFTIDQEDLRDSKTLIASLKKLMQQKQAES